MNYINKYPDGSSYADIRDEHFYDFTYRINSYQKLWELGQIVDACNNNGVSPIVTIPNLIDAQADRRFSTTQSSGLKLVCKFLNSLDAHFKIFHPHNPEVVEALMENVDVIDNEDFIRTVFHNLVVNKFGENFDYFQRDSMYNNMILVSSDAGGFKPLMKLCDKINWTGEVYSAPKSRSYENGKSKLTQIVDREDFQGKDLLIVDDLSIFGGTFKGLSKLLRERNCGKLYLAVSHMTVQELGDDPVTEYYDRVFTTNSKFDEYYVDGNSSFAGQKLEVIKLF